MTDPVTASMALSAGGGIMSAASEMAAAENAKNISKLNAAMSERAAGQKEAASQVEAREAKRKGRLMQSRVLALAAASGGGAMDQDVMNAIAGFEKEGDLAARTALYEGSEAARELRTQGIIGLYEGEVQSKRHKAAAVSSIMGGASSVGSKYGEYSS